MLAATVQYTAHTGTARRMCSTRYEMSLLPESVSGEGSTSGPLFAFKRCLRPLTEEMAAVKGTPLPEDLVQAMFTGLPWEAFAVCPAPHEVAMPGTCMQCTASGPIVVLWCQDNHVFVRLLLCVFSEAHVS